jgi:ribosomal protein L37AE/L43A
MTETVRQETRPAKAVQLCPECGNDRHYRLDDGRLMCRRCRKKFTPYPKTFRLPASCLRSVARNFWWLIPAEEGAKRLGVNRKTMQRYYRHLRTEIAAVSDREIARCAAPGREAGGTGGALPEEPAAGPGEIVCYLAVLGGLVRVVATSLYQQQFWGALRPLPFATLTARRIYPDARYRLDDFHLAPGTLDGQAGERGREFYLIEKFWKFSRRRLSSYRAISPKNLVLLLKEMEFRFNSTDAEAAEQYLVSKLSSVSESTL